MLFDIGPLPNPLCGAHKEWALASFSQSKSRTPCRHRLHSTRTTNPSSTLCWWSERSRSSRSRLDRAAAVTSAASCEIRLEDPNSGDLFAACFVLPGQRESSVETVLDSSRYFVLKIEDGTGKHAFVGLGFGERNEAFDFNVALSDHEKHVRREGEGEGGEEGEDGGKIDIHPAVNHRLKEGETIRINVKSKPTAGTGMLSAAGLSAGGSGAKKPGLLLSPPPATTGKIRSPLPPPPNDPAIARMKSGHGADVKDSTEPARRPVDPLSDLSQIQPSEPSATPRIDAAVPQSLKKTPDLKPSKEEVVSLFAVITGGHLEISRLRLQQSRRQPPPISSLRRRRSSGFSPSSPSPPRDQSPSPATEPSSAAADLELL
ncbi:uncharacterized protein A4U43_C04F1080 [Asparagus officinalis]|uniref:NECAP PHear domain-containing protein n=1 Tax=Asparagus officinalis TaxID=4686 RepID=A0A5P1EY09_ASPOF|nr:uncharacterized protein A4U43_C04F1080 [Asparagus officinalis]